jgi:hypothetical protein
MSFVIVLLFVDIWNIHLPLFIEMYNFCFEDVPSFCRFFQLLLILIHYAILATLSDDGGIAFNPKTKTSPSHTAAKMKMFLLARDTTGISPFLNVLDGLSFPNHIHLFFLFDHHFPFS